MGFPISECSPVGAADRWYPGWSKALGFQDFQLGHHADCLGEIGQVYRGLRNDLMQFLYPFAGSVGAQANHIADLVVTRSESDLPTSS